jgi:hypothetical protein
MAKNTRKNNAMNSMNSMAGGKRKGKKGTRKGRKGGQTPWMKLVMETYREMKKRNPNTRLGDAMKEAKKRM